MKAVFKIIWKILKVYLIATLGAWSLVGIGNYLNDVMEKDAAGEFTDGLPDKLLCEHAVNASQGISSFLKSVKELIVETIMDLF